MVRILVIGIHDISNPGGGAALRCRQHVEVLQNAGHYVAYWAPQPRDWASLPLWQRAINAPRLLNPAHDAFATYCYTATGRENVRWILQNFKPERVIFSEVWTERFLPIVQQCAPDAEIVFDMHNHETQMRRAFGGGYRMIGLKHSERRLMDAAHRVWVCSPEDRESVGNSAEIVPNGVPFNAQPHPQRAPELLGYVGGYDYEPNREAGEILATEIMPRLPSEFEAYLIGKYPNPNWTAPNIHTPGFLPSARDAWRKIGMAVMPIIRGGGTRLKVLEAMARGVPIIATPKAVEGIGFVGEVHGVVCEPWEMPAEIIDLAGDTDRRRAYRNNALELAEKYQWRNLQYE